MQQAERYEVSLLNQEITCYKNLNYPQLLNAWDGNGQPSNIRLSYCGHLRDPELVTEIRDEVTCQQCLKRLERADKQVLADHK